jgi:anti-anti-sigma factor
MCFTNHVRSPAIHVERLDDVAIVGLDGSVEIFHADQIRRVATDLIESHGYRNIVFSLSGVTSVASSGLGVFITLMHTYRGQVQFRFCCLSKPVQSVFAAASLYDFFHVESDVDSSVASLRSTPTT